MTEQGRCPWLEKFEGENGMLGIVLVAVGFVLFHNAWFGLSSKGVAKSGNTLSVVNFLGGAIILIIGILEVTAGNYFLRQFTFWLDLPTCISDLTMYLALIQKPLECSV